MNVPAKSAFRSRLVALAPKSLFGQFFTAVIAAVVLSALIGISINAWIARGLLYELQSDLGNAQLRSVGDLIGRTNEDIAAFRREALQYRKESLRHMTQLMGSYMGSLQREVAQGRMALAQAKRTVIEKYSRSRYGGILLDLDGDEGGDYMFAIDNRHVVVVHPNPDMRVKSSYDLRDSEGVYIVRDLVDAAHRAYQAEKGSFGYTQYLWSRIKGADPEPKLSAVSYFQPWDWVIGTGVYLGDIENAVKARRAALLSELHTRLALTTVGKTGFMFVFDDACNVIAHPLMTERSIAPMRNPDTGAPLCDELKQAAARPPGENVLTYRWKSPDDERNFVYPKVSWVTREPNSGWYVASSVYADEIEAPMVRLREGVILSAFATVVLLGIAVFFLLRNLLRPIEDLSRVCRSVEQGDLGVRVATHVRGELGLLCQRFNGMVESLGESREQELQRRRELAELNENLEREVEIRTQDLSRSTEELKQANERLLEVDRMKSSFLSSVSHELRTPLTSVLGFAKLIGKDFANVFSPLVAGNEKLARRAQRVEQNLGIIVREGERLTRLINDVLDLAKIEAGRVEWRDTVVRIEDLVEHSVQAVTGQFAGLPDVKLEVEVDPDLPSVVVDRDRLTQVLINLLNNAAKFTRAGKVEVHAGLNPKGQVQVAVRDTGPGIPPDFLEKVFEKFQQVTGDTLVDKPQGTGLGLPICREIVQHYGGRIWAESGLGRGATFFFTLPAAQPRARASEPVAAPDAESRGKPLVLVVDDEPGICNLLGQILEDDGYAVISAHDGRAALELARARHPDLITMDLMMPGMDGYEVISRLRHDAFLRGIPIVVITALSEGPRDADAALTKPVDEKRFLSAVRTLLRRASGVGSRVMVLRGASAGAASLKLPVLDAEKLEEVDEEAMWSQLEGGFAGTVIVAHHLLQGAFLERLAAYSNVQVVIVPEGDTRAEELQAD